MFETALNPADCDPDHSVIISLMFETALNPADCDPDHSVIISRSCFRPH